MQGNPKPYDIKKRALLALCGDHGVVAEGVTQTGSEVTKVVSDNFAKGVSTVNRMAKVAGVDVFAVDMGIDCERYPEKNVVTGAVIDRKIARGTNNLAVTSAMTREQCVKALQTGMDLVGELKEQGYKIIATGEMGIGNTTPTSVLAAIFLNLDADKVTGRGAGLSKEGFSVKKQVVSQAVKRIRNAGCRDAVDILAEGGGFEIAGMAGVFLGGVKYHIPIVIDGAISSVAALTAWKINPKVSDYVLASHESEEITGKLALEKLGVEAILHGRMCLGEGTGAMALFPLLDMAFEVYREMGTFEDYALDAYERFE
jgi:nicotinate-nucleotide--dimethylbenzimidazole phosphoribosyltransferase